MPGERPTDAEVLKKRSQLISAVNRAEKILRMMDMLLVGHLITFPDDLKASLQELDAEGNNCFFYAAAGGCSRVLEYLEKLPLDIEHKNDQGHTMLQQLSIEGPTDAVLSLHRLGAQLRVANMAIPEEFSTITDMRKWIEGRIKSYGPAGELPRSRLPTAIEAIKSQLYFTDKNLQEQCMRLLEDLYRNNPIIRPILDVAALAMLGRFKQSLDKKGKKFQVFVSDQHTIAKVCPHIFRRFGGLYRHYNDYDMNAYVKTDHTIANGRVEDLDASVVFGLILHEMSHAVFDFVFNNRCEPFTEGNGDARDSLTALAVMMKQQNEKMASLRERRGMERFLYNDIFETMARACSSPYRQEEYSLELAVRIPEILGAYGSEVGSSYLAHHPLARRLLDFHHQKVHPELLGYLKRIRVHSFISAPTYEEALSLEFSRNPAIYFLVKDAFSSEASIEDFVELLRDHEANAVSILWVCQCAVHMARADVFSFFLPKLGAVSAEEICDLLALCVQLKFGSEKLLISSFEYLSQYMDLNAQASLLLHLMKQNNLGFSQAIWTAIEDKLSFDSLGRLIEYAGASGPEALRILMNEKRQAMQQSGAAADNEDFNFFSHDGVPNPQLLAPPAASPGSPSPGNL